MVHIKIVLAATYSFFKENTAASSVVQKYCSIYQKKALWV